MGECALTSVLRDTRSTGRDTRSDVHGMMIMIAGRIDLHLQPDCGNRSVDNAEGILRRRVAPVSYWGLHTGVHLVSHGHIHDRSNGRSKRTGALQEDAALQKGEETLL